MRLMLSTQVYSYDTLEEAENHVVKMKNNGWRPHSKGIGKDKCVIKRLDNSFPYSVEYFK